MTTLRIAMWSGPRNISTALMRAFENRRDCAVIDEPFYASYLAATGLDHPGREAVLASQPRDWRVVARALREDAPAPLYYQKHMSQHLLPSMGLEFTEGLVNCFLIREPRRIIASYARIRSGFSLEELGFIQQKQLFDRECDRLGYAPPVVDSRAVTDNPESQLRALCLALGIAFDERMLAWPAGPRDSDGVWAPHWYESVWRSTGFAASRPEEAADPVLPPKLEALCQEAEQIYGDLRRHALGL